MIAVSALSGRPVNSYPTLRAVAFACEGLTDHELWGLSFVDTERQRWVSWRADFAVPSQKVIIELDGHDYHKTKQQRTKDAKRERDLEMIGWRVIRFTGTEVYNDVDRCVSDTVELIKKWSNQ